MGSDSGIKPPYGAKWRQTYALCKSDEQVVKEELETVKSELSNAKDNYNNPCPKSYPHLNEWNNSGRMWCYTEKNGRGGVCNMNKSGKKPPYGKKWGTNQKECVSDSQVIDDLKKEIELKSNTTLLKKAAAPTVTKVLATAATSKAAAPTVTKKLAASVTSKAAAPTVTKVLA